MTQLVATWYDTSWWGINAGETCIGTVKIPEFSMYRAETNQLNSARWELPECLRKPGTGRHRGTAPTRDEAALALARACGITDAVPPEVWP